MHLCNRVRALGQVAGKSISVNPGLVTLASTMLEFEFELSYYRCHGQVEQTDNKF